MNIAKGLKALLTVSLVASGVAAAQAQAGGAYAYPNAGQPEQMQSQDRFECHQWSVSQTGFDPSTAPPLANNTPPPPGSGYGGQPKIQQPSRGGFLGIGNGGMLPGSGMVGDAATGAALGAAGGAIAGDAGKGAAIGAVSSTLFGALSRGTNNPTAQPPQAQVADYTQHQQNIASQQYGQRFQIVPGYNASSAPPLANYASPLPGGGYGGQPQVQQPSRGGFLGLGNGGMLPGSGMVGDAATGAALGAAGGAIAGDAGKGAAIGAVSSTLIGALSRATTKPTAQPTQAEVADYARQQQTVAAQQYDQRLQMTSDYNRAFGTCMAARRAAKPLAVTNTS